MKTRISFLGLSRSLALTLSLAAAAFLSSSCEKAPDPSAAPASAPAAASASTAVSAPVPPAPDDAFITASRAHFDAVSLRVERSIRVKEDAAMADYKKRRTARPAPPVTEMMKILNDTEIALRQHEEKTAQWRAKWEAKNWDGYPLPDKLDPVLTNPPITKHDVSAMKRAVPPYLAAAARPAWEDFWKRSDAQRDKLSEEQGDRLDELEAAEKNSVRAGNDITPARKEELARTQEKATEQNHQAKAALDAFFETTIALATAWQARNWEGYTAPADPNAPPPEPPLSQ
jgi:hypothetical protein